MIVPIDRKQLVTESSACLHGFPRQGLHAAHAGMNKFSGPEDPNFKLVRDSIKNLVEKAADILKLRKTGKPTYPVHFNTLVNNYKEVS